MPDPYIGEIRMFAGNFAPAGWALCNGQLLPISEYDALFALYGTTWGGDGQSTFAVPDLRGRLPMHQGTGPGLSNRILGEAAGSETVTLTAAQLPAHSHPLYASTGTADRGDPSGALTGNSGSANIYGGGNPAAVLGAGAIPPSGGGGAPHDNLMPYLCINFIVSLYGVFPSPT